MTANQLRMAVAGGAAATGLGRAFVTGDPREAYPLFALPFMSPRLLGMAIKGSAAIARPTVVAANVGQRAGLGTIVNAGNYPIKP